MLQHNISRDTTLSNEVKLIIDTTDSLYRYNALDPPSIDRFSDIVNITLPNGGIDRVSKIKVDKITVPFTQNINDNNLKFTLFEDDEFSTTLRKDYIIPTLPKYDGSGNVINFIDNIVSTYDADPIYTLDYNYMQIHTDIIPNKLLIRIIESDNSRDDIKLYMAVTNLTYNLGFNEVAVFKHMAMGKTDKNRTDQFEINDSNNSFVITDEFEVLPDITITVPNATYDVYTLGFALAKLGIEYKYYTETGGFTISYKSRRFFIYSTPLTVLMGVTGLGANAIRTTIAMRNYDESFVNNKIAVDYTRLQINSNTYSVPVGNHTPQEVVDILNTQNLYNNTIDPPYPEFQFSYSSITNKVSIVNLRELNGDLIPDPTMYIYGSGLAQLLGLDHTIPEYIESDNASAPNGIYYTFPKITTFTPKYYTVNSNYLKLFRETNTIKYLQYNPYNDNILSTTLDSDIEIFLSRKIKLETFDLFLTNDKGELVSLRDDSLVILLTLTIS